MPKAKIFYHDIGDYLSREEKLAIVKKFGSVKNIPWKELRPNTEGDWLNQRNDVFDTFIPMAPEKKFDLKSQSFFNTYAIGVATNRDAWVYNFSKSELTENILSTVDFFNEQQQGFKYAKASNPKIRIEDFISSDSQKISWTVNLKKDLEKGLVHGFKKEEIKTGTYRPFTKQRLYFDKPFIERPGLSPKLFPNDKLENWLITITGSGSSKDFSALITESITNLDALEKAQCFPLFYYEERKKSGLTLFDEAGKDEFIRRDGVSDFILERARKQYGKNVGKEDIFYYVYGILHSPDYRTAFANDLKKMLPRIPLVEDVRDFWKFSKAGRQLAELHINYESVAPCETCQVSENLTGLNDYRVEKMRFPKKDQKDTIIFNSKITYFQYP